MWAGLASWTPTHLDDDACAVALKPQTVDEVVAVLRKWGVIK